ncbi:MAG TPA: mechanosensitive ion channel family protein [Myxococcota bacterium]|jgi:small conductance mechanosensitive channel|nr:mechanosensitive ion channel family protein [Myxococcota bacterium]
MHTILLEVTAAAMTAGTAVSAAPATAASGPDGVTGTVTTTGGRLVDAVITGAPRVLAVLAALVAAWLVAHWARRLVMRGLERARFDATLTRFFSNFTRYIILTMAVLSCLGAFGIETTSFAAVLGAAGLAVGLAFQGSLSNLAAGVMLLVFRPFKVGDQVVVAGKQGTVMEIELFTTIVDTADHRRFIIPNGAIFGSTVENQSHHPTRRVEVEFATEADVDATRAAVVQALAKVPGRVDTPAPDAVLTGLTAWRAVVWCKTGDYQAVEQAAIKAVRAALSSLAK